MLRLSKLSDYAMVIMAYLAKHPRQICSAKKVASQTGIALPTVSKLLKHLANHQLLTAQRGVQGGYQLALPAHAISLATIIHALDGSLALTECSQGQPHCVVENRCMIRHNWRRISAFVQATLQQISLAELIRPLHLTDRLITDRLKKPLTVIEKS